MNPKQRKLLTRIIVALVLFVAIEVATQTGILRAAFGTPGDVYAEFALFLIPYLIAGYDVIAGALRGPAPRARPPHGLAAPRAAPRRADGLRA